MSFNTMTVKELRRVAELFGVEVEGLNKADILKTLGEEGVTYESYEAFADAPKDDEEEVVAPSPVNEEIILVKMDRVNPSYEVRAPGRTYTFTSRHPFVAVAASDADFIFDVEDGFRIATPKEVKEYYG